MNAPTLPARKRRTKLPDYRLYEQLKATARHQNLTPAEYEAAVRRAARQAVV